MNDVICLFGEPKVIITDQGSEFRSTLDRILYEKLGVEHRISTPYHPETNGLVEWMNQTVKGKLLKMLDNIDDWDLKLPMALMAIRSIKNRSAKKSPLELLIGHPMRLPSHLSVENHVQEAVDDIDEYLDDGEFAESRFHELTSLNDARVIDCTTHCRHNTFISEGVKGTHSGDKLLHYNAPQKVKLLCA